MAGFLGRKIEANTERPKKSDASNGTWSCVQKECIPSRLSIANFPNHDFCIGILITYLIYRKVTSRLVAVC